MTAGTIYVASATATATQKADAAYTCDGTADDQQIQAAIDAVKASGGGRVLLSPGTFHLARPIELAGPGTRGHFPRIALQGTGIDATILHPLGAAAVHLSGFAQCDVADLTVNCYGSSCGITSTSSGPGTWAFWRSTFRNLYFEGSYDGGSTGWALNMDGPFRSVFENIDAVGLVNGIRLSSAQTGFFAGNCTFTRCFMLTYGSNGVSYQLDAIADGILNAVQFNLCEGYADGGTGNTAVRLGGAGQVNHTRWQATNFEQYDTVFHVVNGTGNVIDGTYWDTRTAAPTNTATLVRFDGNAKGNRVDSLTGHYTATAHRLVVSTATNTASPNVVRNVSLTLDPGGTVTNSVTRAAALVTQAITADGANAAGAATVLAGF